MSGVVVTDIRRADPEAVRGLGDQAVATVHEAMGRRGLVGPSLSPIQQGARIVGTAVTVLCWPGDNLMIHAAVEQCQAGDVLVVTTQSPSLDGSFGELFATALKHRGVLGLITTGGVRDVQDLRQMDFPVWSGAVNAQGTVKATPGSVNVPIVVGGVTVSPGDVIIADDDGVLCIPRDEAASALTAAEARVAKEEVSRSAYQRGALSLDHNNLRPVLAELGVRYLTEAAWTDERR